jgi:phosphatidylinositol alpha-1,6-mannosyltransferase
MSILSLSKIKFDKDIVIVKRELLLQDINTFAALKNQTITQKKLLSMNIFFLGYSLVKSAGGIENYTRTVLSHLKQKGHRIVTCTLDGVPTEFDGIYIKNTSRLERYLFCHRLAHQITKRGYQFDMFLCGHIYLYKIMEKLVKISDQRYQLFVYGIDSWGDRFAQRLPRMKRLDKVISISSFTSNQITAQGFTGEIVYLPPVLDVDKYPLTTKALDLKRKVVFLTVGRLSSEERYKGHENVIKALRLLIDRGIRNIEYWIVGNGDDMPRIMEEVKKIGIVDYVRFYGHVTEDELNKIYKTADVFIMPSRVCTSPKKPEGEGFGIAFIEAGINQLPVIGPDTGGSMDIIVEGVTGLTCSPQSPLSIAEKMLYLIQNPDFRVIYGMHGRTKVINQFSLSSLDNYLDKLIAPIV